ncbi:MAG TPA: dienelactone hydrolase family protein [Kofleriaceae bacterium]|nr:dienelactone hydrolase family protein [Kofleriaceae bacterium]
MATAPFPPTTVVPVAGTPLEADLVVPAGAAGVVAVAAPGAGRVDPRCRYLAAQLTAGGFATLLVDLITESDEGSGRIRAPETELELIATRLEDAVRWLRSQSRTAALPVGIHASGAAAAAGLIVAARAAGEVTAVVAAGGRPDLAGAALERVQAPVLIVVGGADDVLRALAERARDRLGARAELHVVAGAGQRFDEPGALDEANDLAVAWFQRHLGRAAVIGPRLWLG